MTISPSSTNRRALRPSRSSITSGKYRPSGLPALDWIRIVSASLKARQRNPSHLGSYCQSGPDGSSSTDAASIGGGGEGGGGGTRTPPPGNSPPRPPPASPSPARPPAPP